MLIVALTGVARYPQKARRNSIICTRVVLDRIIVTGGRYYLPYDNKAPISPGLMRLRAGYYLASSSGTKKKPHRNPSKSS